MSPFRLRVVTSLLVVVALLAVSLGNGLLPVSLPQLFAASEATPVASSPSDDFNSGDPVGTPLPIIQSGVWGAPATRTSIAAAPLGASLAVATPTPCQAGNISCIKHVFVIMMENQSFDRLFGAWKNPQGTPVEGLPTRIGTPGTPGTCLADPRATLVPTHALLPVCSYVVPVPFSTPTPGPYDPAVPTATFTGVQNGFINYQDSVDNPHGASDGQLDITGVTPPTGGVPTPMTGFLAAAFNHCQTPHLALPMPPTTTPATRSTPPPFRPCRRRPSCPLT